MSPIGLLVVFGICLVIFDYLVYLRFYKWGKVSTGLAGRLFKAYVVAGCLSANLLFIWVAFLVLSI